MQTTDLFDGTFDNTVTGRREVWQDGHLKRYVRRNATGNESSCWRELHAPWGTYPDLPSNAMKAA